MEHKMNLYEIDAAIMNLAESFVDEETGEITVDPAQLDALEMAKVQKITNICRYTRNLKAQIVANKEEAARFSTRASQLGKMSDGLKKLLIAVIPEGEKVKDELTDTVLVSWRKSSAVVIDDEEKVMELYPDCVKITKSLNKTALEDKLKTVGIDGVRIEDRQNIQIK